MKLMTLRHPFTNPIKRFVPDGGLTSIFRTIGFIGDSLSSGEHESFDEVNGKGYHDYYEYSWGEFIARKIGCKAHIFAKGGLKCSTFFEYIKVRNNPFEEEKKCQAYVIALGVNDMNHLDEAYPDGFGSLDDIDWENEDNNKMSFVGQYVRIIQKLRKFSPKCRIFVLTTPKERPEAKDIKAKYDKMRRFLLSLPGLFEFLYVLDLRKYAPIYGKRFGKRYFCGGHMSASGYKFTADMVMTYIDYIIRHKPEDFTQVGFINRDVHNSKYKW